MKSGGFLRREQRENTIWYLLCFWVLLMEMYRHFRAHTREQQTLVDGLFIKNDKHLEALAHLSKVSATVIFSGQERELSRRCSHDLVNGSCKTLVIIGIDMHIHRLPNMD